MTRKACRTLLVLWLLPLLSNAQTHSESSNAGASGITIRKTTRLVQVDVVVTDKLGNPITGLKPENFTVMQDGKPQEVRAFEAHVADAGEGTKTAGVRVLPVMPPHTYTNFPLSAQDQSWTIVLYDVLNTPTPDQQNARKALLDLLRSLPPGRPVALFSLSQRLEMLEGFSRDPQSLVAAAEKLAPSRSPLLSTEGEREYDIAFEKYKQLMLMPGAAPSDDLIQANFQRAKQQYANEEDARTQQRILFTLDALDAMARTVSGYPGRKNLIWLSGSFPLRTEPNQAALDPFRNSAGYLSNMQHTSSLLTESRVAVYPVDVRGILTTGVDQTLPDHLASVQYVGPQQVTSGGTSNGIANVTNDRLSGLLHEQFVTHANERESMTEAAYETGGRAFFGNDFAGAMRKVLADGSTYYTIAYTPPAQKEKGNPYHRIEVKLNRPDASLSYRRGYYSTPQQKPTAEQGTAALQGALQPGMPPSTMLFMMATVIPPGGKQKTVKIKYIISPNNVTFTNEAENKKHVVVDCIAIAFDKDGKEVAHASDTLDGAIPQAAYDAVMQQGLPASQEIELKPGTYNLRLGVMDRATQQIGTVDVPLEIPATAEGK